jgi:hypothetical protein
MVFFDGQMVEFFDGQFVETQNTTSCYGPSVLVTTSAGQAPRRALLRPRRPARAPATSNGRTSACRRKWCSKARVMVFESSRFVRPRAAEHRHGASGHLHGRRTPPREPRGSAPLLQRQASVTESAPCRPSDRGTPWEGQRRRAAMESLTLEGAPEQRGELRVTRHVELLVVSKFRRCR